MRITEYNLNGYIVRFTCFIDDGHVEAWIRDDHRWYCLWSYDDYKEAAQSIRDWILADRQAEALGF